MSDVLLFFQAFKISDKHKAYGWWFKNRYIHEGIDTNVFQSKFGKVVISRIGKEHVVKKKSQGSNHALRHLRCEQDCRNRNSGHAGTGGSTFETDSLVAET